MQTTIRLAVVFCFCLTFACQRRGANEAASLQETAARKVSFIAHMGLSSEAPANTLPAFELAGKSGAFIGIETDVRETKDGEFVLYHDETLDTRTTGSGTVISQTLARIQTYTVRKGNNLSKYENLRVPTLDAYLEICKKYRVKPVLHIKHVTDGGIKNLVAKVTAAGLLKDAIVTGGKKDMTRFRAASKDVTLYWMNLISNPGTDWAAANNIHINTDQANVTAEKVAYAHGKGLKVGAWTVNDSKVVQSLAKAGVDFITTDYVQKP